MKLFIFMGASGSGKSSIQHSLPISFMTNYTTRPLREGEIDGYHINQISHEEFIKYQREGLFYETTEYAGNLYGTPQHSIENLLSGTPYHCTKDINGAKTLKEGLGDRSVIIYIKPPSLDVFATRMLKRGDNESNIKRRLEYLKKTNEIENEKYADYVIINDDLKKAQIEAHQIVIKELLKAKGTYHEQ
ncbi:guanylate kinase [Siminovitchia sp. 179-K 8D1 HS]|uniref:guanylate kinase n=1 Tax=Siminovitchia sp. 179-K 8D1 HS TaxID=3142385 RepID=UPI0039A3104C